MNTINQYAKDSAKKCLNYFRVSEFVKRGDKISMALSELNRLIINLSFQVPIPHRADADKIYFLHNATVWYSWSQDPLSRVATNDLSFKMKNFELERLIKLSKGGTTCISQGLSCFSSTQQFCLYRTFFLDLINLDWKKDLHVKDKE